MKQPIFTAGPPPEKASAAVVLLHGRGARAEGMLTISHVISAPEVSWVAPQAREGAWYPDSGRAPLERNLPQLLASFDLVSAILEALEERGIPGSQVMLLGFSQGACVAVEYTLRNPGRIGALAALSGGLMGPQGTPWRYTGGLQGLPAYLGSSQEDPYIPKRRALDTARVLVAMGASVRSDVFPGSEHTINDNELSVVRMMIHFLARKPLR